MKLQRKLRSGMTQCRTCLQYRGDIGLCRKFNLPRRPGNGCTEGTST
ncbi:MAG TPA: hypothetical protein VM695_10145 [Phycisphaerae bacterium]|nr:hypothetical protein [Phycisphaerae bacterium]